MELSNRNIISSSHKRSKDYGIKEDNKVSTRSIKDEILENLIKENSELINIAKTYMDMFKDVLKDRSFIIVLTDKDGFILHISGQDDVIRAYENVNIVKGMCMDEKSIGTNAMAIALEEDRPVQITAGEHYINMFKKLTCSAAPIHGISGEIIGTLNLTSDWTNKHPHSLGLVLFGVKAIENELERRHVSDILKETYNYVVSVMNNVDKGIITVDSDENINNVNDLAIELLGLCSNDLIGKKIETIIPGWKNIYISFKKENYNTYVKEIKVFNNKNKNILVTVKAIRSKERVVGAVIMMLNKIEISNKNNKVSNSCKTFDDILGDSDAILNVITNCKIVANSPYSILLEGEDGTEKEVLAEAIHNDSDRKNNKFVELNCSKISKNSIDSELYGYDKGAFSGLKEDEKIGKFELANGGTIFLDEVGEMPFEMQLNVLKVIEEGRIRRIGSNKDIPIDVRLICATNKNLKEEVAKGKFSEELFYKLSVIPIYVPSLRERYGDVKKLIDHFLRVKAFRLNKEIPKLSESLYNKLLNYYWPGNIKELENCIENIVNLDGNISYDFDIKKENNKCHLKNNDDSNKGIYIEIGDRFNIKDIEKILIEKAIKFNDYNMSKTAKALGISRNTLYYKLNKYDIY